MSNEAVFSTTSITMSSVAVPGFLFEEFSASMASSPSGVAALPMPRTFALMFDAILPPPMSDANASGNIKRSMGDMRCESFDISPFFSKTFIHPHHRHILPTSDTVRLTALSAPSNTEVTSVSVLCVKNENIKESTHKKQKILPINEKQSFKMEFYFFEKKYFQSRYCHYIQIKQALYLYLIQENGCKNLKKIK